MRLFFIRHGQSSNNALWARMGNEIDRVPDPEITDTGRRQLHSTANFLDFCLTSDISMGSDPSCGTETGNVVIFCSLMTRAIQSASIIAERLQLPVYANLDIHESGGIYRDDFNSGSRIGEKGLSKVEVNDLFPHVLLPAGMNPEGWWNRPFEEREFRRERVAKVLHWLTDTYGSTTDTIILVSHAGFYNYFMRQILGLNHDDYSVWFEFFNGAATLFNFDNGNVNIFYSNRFDFMPMDIVT
jgi:2,3-bisphosphoglycerate-dependent phosphoglycerate mutase